MLRFVSGTSRFAGSSGAVAPVAGGSTNVGQITASHSAPAIVEAGWRLTRLVVLSNLQSAHFNPIDGRLYAARRAVTTSPFSAAAHISCILRGATFAVTEILPFPPSRISATAVGSSPL